MRLQQATYPPDPRVNCVILVGKGTFGYQCRAARPALGPNRTCSWLASKVSAILPNRIGQASMRNPGVQKTELRIVYLTRWRPKSTEDTGRASGIGG
jgi:hypothetical protein